MHRYNLGACVSAHTVFNAKTQLQPGHYKLDYMSCVTVAAADFVNAVMQRRWKRKETQ